MKFLSFCFASYTCPFVFYDGEQYKEMQEDRKNLKDLIKELGIEVIYLKEENGEYSVIEE